MSELEWRKSSRSSTEPQCVEVAWPEGGTWIRDSKNADGERIKVSRAAWAGLVGIAKASDPS